MQAMDSPPRKAFDRQRSDPDTMTEPSTQQPATAELPKDDLFHLLSNRRRRDALAYLAANENPVDMRDLAERIAAWEHDTTVENLTSDQRQRVYIALYQAHLPKLDEYGVIDYNRPRGVVKRLPRARQLDRYLEPVGGAADEDDLDADPDRGGIARPENRYAVAIGAIGVGMLAVAGLELVPPIVLLAITWTTIVGWLFAVGATGLMEWPHVSSHG